MGNQTGSLEHARPDALLRARLALVLIPCFSWALACAHRATGVLSDVPSRFNGRVIVIDTPEGPRSMLFEPNGAVQSLVSLGQPLRLELPYAQAAALGLALVRAPRRVLVMGLGGGSLPMFVHRVEPAAVIDVVDVDPVVVEAARDYFDFREDERVRVSVADGRQFLERSPASYDLMMLDAYGRRGIPRHLTTRGFLAAVQRRLAPEGWVVANLWSEAANSLYPAMRRTYEASFKYLCVVRAGDSGNHIFLASNHAQVSPRQLTEAARRLVREFALPFDLPAYAKAGCLDEASTRSAPVLRDGAVAGP